MWETLTHYPILVFATVAVLSNLLGLRFVSSRKSR